LPEAQTTAGWLTTTVSQAGAAATGSATVGCWSTLCGPSPAVAIETNETNERTKAAKQDFIMNSFKTTEH
jgi:hypothetical protein